MEPNYVGQNGRLDAMAAAWLLDEDHVFFLDDEITWDGHNHGFTGAQVNAGNMDEVPVFMSNCEMLMNGVLDLMMTLENDEALRVPREAINPSLHEAIRDGDLTGITLFNLIACGHAIKILNTQEEAYQVIYDNRLARGIPAFYKLVSRMIWDMRGYNGVEDAFEVTFASARNVDADQYLRDFNGMVPGAISEPMWTEVVGGEPIVELPSDDEISQFTNETAQQFASGFDAPTDMQADEDLFESMLSSLACEFPKTIAIEGTHVLGRAARIESIKVGDPLVLASDWQSQYFNPVCIEVFDVNGDTLGNLNEQFTPALSGNRELACLLPYITATVESVTPLSQRRKGSKYALMDVRMELDSNILDDGLWAPRVCKAVVDNTKRLLALPAAERVVLSKGDLVASDLKGAVSVACVEDIPNPTGSVFEKPATEKTEAVSDVGEPTGDEFDLSSLFSDVLGALDNLADSLADEMGVSREELDAMAEEEKSKIGGWTFEQGKTAKGRRFSIELPDQYAVVEDCGGRPLAVPVGFFQEGEDADYSESPQVIYSDMLGDLDVETREAYLGAFVPEARIQMNRQTVYSNVQSSLGGGIVDDWLVDGKNCQVQIFDMELPSFFGPPSHEYYVKPVVYDYEDQLRITDSFSSLAAGELKNLAFAIAKTVELDKPMEPKRVSDLSRFCESVVGLDEFTETVNAVSNILVMSTGWRMSGRYWREKRNAGDELQEFVDSVPRLWAETYNEALADRAKYFDKFVNALEVQKRLGNAEFEAMWKLVGEVGDLLMADHLEIDDDAEMSEAANATGVIAIPECYKEYRSNWLALAPDGEAKSGEIALLATEDTAKEPRKINEAFDTAAIPRIEKALNEQVTASYFIETSEIAADALMSARQAACNSATNGWNSDEDNVTAMAQEFANFNPIICRYYGYFVDALEAQVEFGNAPDEIRKMANEVNEFSELVADHFSCGNAYLDDVANSRSPVSRPEEYDEIHARWQKVIER